MPALTITSRLPAPERPLIDISVPLSAATPEWPGDKPFTCGWTLEIANGEAINLSEMSLSPHVGTHADAPLHVLDGWPGSEGLTVSAFVGVAYVLDVRHSTSSVMNSISLEWMQEQFAGETPERLLLYTGQSISGGTFPESWPVLTADAASWLVKSGTRLVGTDAPSVDERHSKDLVVHRELFLRGAFVLENLVLAHVPVGWYELFAAPLRVTGLDAAPVRALLRPLAERT